MELQANKVKLQVQKINLKEVMSNDKVRKVFFQFQFDEMDGDKAFKLVGYMAEKTGKNTGDDKDKSLKSNSKWKITGMVPIESTGKYSELPVEEKDGQRITFGNLELYRPDIENLKKSGKTEFLLNPAACVSNYHAGYDITDGVNTLASTHPSPPAPPYEDDAMAS